LQFTGLWHEISSYYSENAMGTCARAEYTLEGGVVNVVNSQVVNQGLTTINGTATVIDVNGGGKLSVTLEVAPGGKHFLYDISYTYTKCLTPLFNQTAVQ
jgi:lipocalin